MASSSGLINHEHTATAPIDTTLYLLRPTTSWAMLSMRRASPGSRSHILAEVHGVRGLLWRTCYEPGLPSIIHVSSGSASGEAMIVASSLSAPSMSSRNAQSSCSSPAASRACWAGQWLLCSK